MENEVLFLLVLATAIVIGFYLYFRSFFKSKKKTNNGYRGHVDRGYVYNAKGDLIIEKEEIVSNQLPDELKVGTFYVLDYDTIVEIDLKMRWDTLPLDVLKKRCTATIVDGVMTVKNK